ncbi:MAG: efflux RND transporter periplasmic adaptor subunit [Pseudomonadota bacterium]
MGEDPFQKKKSLDIGLLVRRLVVVALPLLLIVGAVGGNVVMSALAPKPEEKEEVIKATPVVVAEARAETVRLSVTTQGEAFARTAISVMPQVGGKIVYVSPQFVEGGAFEPGDVLLKIEPREFALRVTQARASVAQARSRYESEKAEADVARLEWERLGGEANALALREPQLAEARAMLASAEASLDEARLQLDRTAIKAPFKGRVQTRNLGLGQFVVQGQTLGEIFSTETVEVALPLTDAEVGQLGLNVGFQESDQGLEGLPVSLTAIVAGAPRTWKGRITRTGAAFDRSTRVLFAYAEVKDPYGAGADDGAPLAAGLFVTAVIDGREIENGVVIPRAALRGEDRVFVARDDATLEIRTVSVASSNRREAVLTSGVKPGERVITSPVRGAADGVAIAVAGDQAAEDEAGATVAKAIN